MDGCHFFFEEIGGITENIRFDNLAPAVKEVLKGDRRIYTVAFQRALDYYGFKPLPGAPGKGSDKGDVEREIRSNAGHLRALIKVEGLAFQDYTAASVWLNANCKARHNESVLDNFQQEHHFSSRCHLVMRNSSAMSLFNSISVG